MPDVESNRSVWAHGWDWGAEGDEWSAWWGGTHAMWLGAFLPRLHAFVPTGTILEIAPGHGRWTQYLKDLADELVAVDLTERCIEHCKERFAAATNIAYHVNDGRSLEMIEDGSIDLAISFDSLVHVDPSVIEAYLAQLATKLRPDGIGLLHHSNAGSYRKLAALTKRTPGQLRRKLVRRGWLLDVGAWRDESMTAATFAELCAAHGLSCIGQEEISWEHGRFRMDALSLFTRPGSRWDRPNRSIRSPGFGAEGHRMRTLWTPSSFGAPAP